MKNEYDDLEEIFDDPELLNMARLLRTKQAPSVDADPAFRSMLRRQLMQQAWELAHPSPPWWRQLFAPRGMAWGGAMAGTVAVALLVVLFAVTNLGGTPSVAASNQTVAATDPISLTFTASMNHESVEKAIKIEPATDVRFEWEGNTLHVVPASGSWAPNVQYHVTIEQSAVAENGKALSQPQTIPVQIPPTPTPIPAPTPSATPTPTPTPATLGGVRQLANVSLSADHTWLAWSPDGQQLYVIDAQGRLSAVPIRIGLPSPLSDTGVSLAALAPGGAQLAYVRAGKIWTVPATGGAATAVAVVDGPVLAIGWRGGAPVWATGDAVFTVPVPPTAQVTTSPPPASAPPVVATPTTVRAIPVGSGQALGFSPSGDRLAYRAGPALRVLDVASGADVLVATQLGAAARLLAWSPDGRRVVYQDGSQTFIADAVTQVATKVAIPAQATAAAWSAQGGILLSGPQGLSLVSVDGSNPQALDSGSFQQLAWAPNGADIAFNRANGLWVARVQGPATGPAPTLDAGLTLIDDFMRARVAGNADQIQRDLDETGKAAYSGSGPALSSSGLSRYYVVAAQDTGAGLRFTVRLIFSQGKLETQSIDETLTLEPDATGKLLVHSVEAGPRQDLGKSPTVTLATISATQLKLSFDSDLDPKTVPGAVVVSDPSDRQVAAAAAYSGNRMIVIDTSKLTPGTAYQVTVQTTLRDVSGRSVATQYTLDFVQPK